LFSATKEASAEAGAEAATKTTKDEKQADRAAAEQQISGQKKTPADAEVELPPKKKPKHIAKKADRAPVPEWGGKKDLFERIKADDGPRRGSASA
jgi:hypothetical protein